MRARAQTPKDLLGARSDSQIDERVNGIIIGHLVEARRAFDDGNGNEFGIHLKDLGRDLKKRRKECDNDKVILPVNYAPFDELNLIEMLGATLQVSLEAFHAGAPPCFQALHGCIICMREMCHTHYYRDLIDETLYGGIHELIGLMRAINPDEFIELITDFVKLLAKLSESESSNCSGDIDVLALVCNICESSCVKYESLGIAARRVILNMTRSPITDEGIQRAVVRAVHNTNQIRKQRSRNPALRKKEKKIELHRRRYNKPGVRVLLQLVINKSLHIETFREKGLFTFVGHNFLDHREFICFVGHFMNNYPEHAEEMLAYIDIVNISLGLHMLRSSETIEITPEFSREAGDVCWAICQIIERAGPGAAEETLMVVVELIKEYWLPASFTFKQKLSLLYMTILRCAGQAAIEHLAGGGIEILQFVVDMEFDPEFSPKLICIVLQIHELAVQSGQPELLEALQEIGDNLILTLRENDCNPELIEPLVAVFEQREDE